MAGKEEYILTHSDNDLDKIFHQLNESRSKPYINYQVGRITNILWKFYFKKMKKFIKYIIVSQCLSKDRFDEDMIADSEQVYNKVTTSIFNFQ